jgi:hypothetical protein
MNIRKVAGFGIILLFNHFGLADASYQETSQITGGSMVDGLKSVSFFSKSLRDAFAPTTTTTMVHGNQKAVVSKETTEITDLDRETITRIDNTHKTYTVQTFAQIREAMANAQKQLAQAQEKVKEDQPKQAPPPQSDVKTSFDVSAKNTGVTKEVNGLTAQEQLITMQAHMTDPKAAQNDPNSVTYVITTDAWIAPDPPEVKEVRDFDLRYAQKLMSGVDMSLLKAQMMQLRDTSQNPALMQMFGGKPGSAEAMTEMAKEMEKLQGTRVMEVTRMGGSATGPAQDSAHAAPASQPAADAPPTTVSGMLGSALGGSMLGGFHKKKAAAQPDAAPAANTTTTTDGATTTTSTTLMEMTMQKSNFSQAAVATSNFQVPPGFKKIDSPSYGSAGK